MSVKCIHINILMHTHAYTYTVYRIETKIYLREKKKPIYLESRETSWRSHQKLEIEQNKTKDKLRNNRYKLVTWSWNPFRKKPKVRQQNKNPAKKHAAKTLHLYLLPIFHHLTCKSTLHCKSGFGTINCHSKLNIYTLLKKQVNKQVYPK